jgi:molybdopterin synthase catalytic subunit
MSGDGGDVTRDERIRVTVQEAPFDVGEAVGRARHGDPGVGAVAAFVGVCRDVNEGTGVQTLWLEHYPGMTEKAIESIVAEAFGRWALRACEVVHRVGRLEPTDPIVMVVVTAAHRGDAFAACEFVMDYLKTRAPFWKKESTGEGNRWVAARASDEASARRWRR